MFRVRSSAVVIGAILLVATACGSDAKSESTAPPATASSTSAPSNGASSTPTTASTPTSDAATSSTDGAAADTFSVQAANGTVTLPAKPMRIVSLAPSQTETLFAIGAGDQVIAVDDQSNYPAEAEAKKSTLSGYTPNVEAIASYKPDLVVIADDFNGLAAQLQAVNIPVWSGPAATSLDDAYSQIEQLGVLTGHVADAAGVVAKMQSDIAAITKDVVASDPPLTYYHELDNTLFSITSDTFIGQIYAMAGLRNIADGAEAGNSYPQLNNEFIITANPDLIFLADVKCCGESAATVKARDGWGGIAAVKNGHVIELDDDVVSRWGPRIPDFLRDVVDAVKSTQSGTVTTATSG